MRRRPRILRWVLALLAAASVVSLLLCLLRPRRSPVAVAPDDDDDRTLLQRQLRMLSPTQLARYRAITELGTVTREDVEVVLSRHHEDVRWSDAYANVRTVYDKPTDGAQDTLNPATTRGRVVRLTNVGRESYTYLYHIVSNYDRLARLTVFSHGSAPQHGYRGHRRGGGHLLANSTFHDFVLSTSPRGHFVFTGAVWLPTLAHVLRAGYNKEGATRRQALATCPTPALTESGGSEYRFDLDDRPHLSVLQHIAALCAAETAAGNATTDTCTGPGFWRTYIKVTTPLPHLYHLTEHLGP